MRDHRKLRASELADEVVLLIYRATREFPKEEMYCGSREGFGRPASINARIAKGSETNSL